MLNINFREKIRNLNNEVIEFFLEELIAKSETLYLNGVDKLITRRHRDK